MAHRIVVTFEKPSLGNFAVKNHIKKCILAALRCEGVSAPCEINVFVCGDETIRAINKSSREIDKATDVLSFPMFTLTPGDMAISLERAAQQAKEFGHSTKREVGYLTIHSILHLLGYDHVDEGPMKRQMRAREEAILADIELSR